MFAVVGLPQLQLSPHEARFVSLYGTRDKPSVRRRVTPLRLLLSSFPNEVSRASVQFTPAGRYAKVCALTFSGDIQAWDINARLGTDQLLITDFTRVASLINVLARDDTGMAPDTTLLADTLARVPGEPLVFEPGVVLRGNQNLTINGNVPAGVGVAARAVLNICVHWWDFPDLKGL